MTTDPYPAIRKQVEALERALAVECNTGDDVEVGAARAALNRRVEELITCDSCGSMVWECDKCANRVDLYERLNEEPDDALDIPRRSGQLGGSHTHAGGDE